MELRWAGTAPLEPPDERHVAARLELLGVVELPSALRRFPADLAHAQVTGIYPDGWLERVSSVVLAGGPAASLVVRVLVPAGKDGQRLDVLVDGRRVATRNAVPGPLEVRAPLAASRSGRRVELRWAGTIPLAAPDTRHAAAILRFVGIAPPAGG